MNPIDICTDAFNYFFVSDGKTLYRETRSNLEKCYNAPDGWSVEAMTKILAAGFPIGTNPIHLRLFLRREDSRQSKVVKVISAARTPTEFQYDNLCF